jgi:post-segregation antitoxin (ccd killing protein)
MRMARVNVYLPDDLAGAAKSAGLNVSALTQEAVRGALASGRTNAWLADVLEMKAPPVDVAAVLAAVREARDELERGRA